MRDSNACIPEGSDAHLLVGIVLLIISVYFHDVHPLYKNVILGLAVASMDWQT